MFLLYNLLLTFTAPIWVPWMLLRANRRKEKPNWKERMGEIPFRGNRDKTRIWLHAVSVGETMAAAPILRELRRQAPSAEIVLSVTTSSGHQTARDNVADLYDHLVYFPVDVARFQLAAMARAKPHVVVVMETELWLNFLWAAKAVGARAVLANGRISDRSFPRARFFRFFYRALLGHFDRVLAQTERDAERLRTLGAPGAEAFGNAKFDEAIEGLDADASEWRRDLGLDAETPVVVVGSTRGEDEERVVLDALQGLECQVVHAPRHLERADSLAAEAGRRFPHVARRSQGGAGSYLILDTYGELSKAYCVADLAIVGGGFADLGGQNLLQPLAHGKPVLHGPHMQNFADIARLAGAAGATRVCADANILRSALNDLLGDKATREAMGRAATAFVQAHAGASARYAEAILTEAERAAR